MTKPFRKSSKSLTYGGAKRPMNLKQLQVSPTEMLKEPTIEKRDERVLTPEPHLDLSIPLHRQIQSDLNKIDLHREKFAKGKLDDLVDIEEIKSPIHQELSEKQINLQKQLQKEKIMQMVALLGTPTSVSKSKSKSRSQHSKNKRSTLKRSATKSRNIKTIKFYTNKPKSHRLKTIKMNKLPKGSRKTN